MSLLLIESEIRRFLGNRTPEVLCIKGKWGVGKTYAWRKFLQEAVQEGRFPGQRYSYVSMFGISSLESLRFSIFENTVSGANMIEGANLDTFNALLAKGSDFTRRMKPMVDMIAAVFNRKNVTDVLMHAGYLAVREQLVCFDDLERAGKGLDARDILGLASDLKESRRCKVVLLLNEEQMDSAAREEFNRQLEKVADVAVSFDLTPPEATEIALSDGIREIRSLIEPRLNQLRITNIRVIKKIERLANRLDQVLSGYDRNVVEQAMAALVLGGYSVFQPGIAPGLKELRSFNRLLQTMEQREEEVSPNLWADILEDYPFWYADDFDNAVLDGASSGYFDEERLGALASARQMQLRQEGKGDALNTAWKRFYHESLAGDDDEFLSALYLSALETVSHVSLGNLNSAVSILREFGRPDRADELIEEYIKVHSSEPLDFFDISEHMFTHAEHVDPVLRASLAKRYDEYDDPRDPLEVLKSFADGTWERADITVMRKQTADDFERLFESISGVPFRRPLQTLLSMCRNNGEGVMQANVTEALRRIAAKSPVRKRKVQSLGVEIPPPEGTA